MRMITRALNPVEKKSERINKKLRETSKTLNLSDINKFENHNSSISVNVFSYEKSVYPLRIIVYTLRISKHNYNRERSVNLLFI